VRICTRAKDFGGALDFAVTAVPKRTTIPALAHMKISAIGENRLRMTATDFNLELTAETEAQIDQPGVAVVPASRIAKLIGELPRNAEVTLSLDDERLLIVAGRGRWRLPTLPLSDFPILSPPQQPVTVMLDRAEALRFVRRLAAAISTEETRYWLNGVLLAHRDGRLIAASTDARRLSEITVNAVPVALPDIIIPAKTVELLGGIARQFDHVELLIDAQRISIRGSCWQATSKLVDGTFPEYAHEIPSVASNRIDVGRNDLLGAIQRLAAIADPDDLARGVGLTWDGKVIELCLPRVPPTPRLR
jgi:DNA polymerase-3 subunit beta